MHTQILFPHKPEVEPEFPMGQFCLRLAKFIREYNAYAFA